MRLKCVQVRRDFTVIARARDLPMLWCAASPSWRVPYFVIRLGAIGSLAGKVSSMVINQLLLALVQVLASNPITGRVLDSQIRVDPSRVALLVPAGWGCVRHGSLRRCVPPRPPPMQESHSVRVCG